MTASSQIEGAIDEAEKTRKEARELLAEYRRQIDEARGEARQILDEARKQGEAQRERTKREAREEGDRIIQRAREEIERERDGALRDVRREVADMVIQTSERVIGRALDQRRARATDLRGPRQPRRPRSPGAGGDDGRPLSAVSTYAEALFEAARERDELEAVLEELQEFVDALEESEELRLFFYGGQVPEREKRRAIDALTEGMTISTRNFLKVLSDNGREEILEEVVMRYEELVKEHLGRVEVQVTTAVELSEEEVERASRSGSASVLEGREVILETRVDPEHPGRRGLPLRGAHGRQ